MYLESFKELKVWQRAIDLAKEVYMPTEQLPKTETFGLSSQMRRCAISIPSNIAEGRKRGTRKDFVQFLRIAGGSAAELETQLILLRELYTGIQTHKIFDLLEEVQKMLSVMTKRLVVPQDFPKSYKLKAKS